MVLHLLGVRVSIAGPAAAVIAVALAGVAMAQQPAANAAISGTVTDGVTGRPLASAIVALRAPANGAPLARIVRVVTAEQGRFVMRDLPAGEGYSIATTRLGYVDGAYGQQTMFGAAG
ncbi:MAG TPA: carboxypeptidase-like regulatory domain-containing protein, partial [Vicinamibacterales bacterium]|nr:carboxypeptidase-like regulatory domain-containing protein [Vicinamibacterales bacterium]